VKAALSSALILLALGLRAWSGGHVTRAGSQARRCTMWMLKSSVSENEARDQHRSGRGKVEARKRRRMRPTVLALEDRMLLSTFTVNSTIDSTSVGSLRWAIDQANSAGGAETIAFDSKAFKTPQTIYNDTTTLSNCTISGNTGSLGGGVVSENATTTLTNCTVSGNSATFGSGLAFANCTAKLTKCIVSGNSATEEGAACLTTEPPPP
jgi:hypothetical protein